MGIIFQNFSVDVTLSFQPCFH